MKVVISTRHFAEAVALCEEGDIDLDERKLVYSQKTGSPCPISGDALKIAAMTEDADDDEFVNRVNQIRDHGYEVVPDQPAAE